MSVSLREITKDNFRAVIGLKVAPGQEHFVASNVYSIAQAWVYPEFAPLAVYSDETVVGFLMHGPDDDQSRHWIIRLMIGADHQRQGHGRAAMNVILGQFRSVGRLREVFISYEPDNQVARRLYASLGFVETGEVVEGENVARLGLDF